MLELQILSVSKRPVPWVRDATDTYIKRLRGQLNLSIVDIPPVSNQASREIQLEKEAERLQRACPDGAYKVVLDERGRQWRTAEFARELGEWREDYSKVVFFVGGASGLDRAFVDRADHRWALSSLTLPHQLVRVVLSEQIYRAWSILSNHPYHRE